MVKYGLLAQTAGHRLAALIRLFHMAQIERNSAVSRKSIALAVLITACAGGAATVRTTPTPPAPQTVASAPQATSPVAATTRLPGTVWPDEGVRTWTPRPTEQAISPNDLRTRLYQISDDSMKGRAAATQGNFKAAEYVAAEFKRLGLRPAGENGTYFQEIQFGQLVFDSLKVQLMVEGAPLRPGVDWTPMRPDAASAISGNFAGQNVRAVFGGRLGDTARILDPSAVRGNVVVFLPALPVAPDPSAAGGAGGGRGGGGGGRGGGRGGGGNAPPRDLRAQTAGAAAVFQVVDSLASAFGARRALMPFTTSTTAGANIKAGVAAGLFDRPLDQLAIGTVGKNVSGRWTYEYQSPEFPARNIIAVLPGSDPALRGQYVLVGAHNDHVGMRTGPPLDHDSLRAFNRVIKPQGANDPQRTPTAAEQRRIDSLIAYARFIRPPRRDTVMNGADDDGSGTALLLEIAERFAMEGAPKRSIIFISHAAEENGLLGSQYFTNHPTIPRDSIVAAHNMDMVGNGGVTDVKFGGPSQVQMLGARRLSSEFGDVIDSLNAVRSETMAIDYSWDRTNALNRFCRSDQVSYFRFAIPVTYFSTGYGIDYHMATDEPQYIDYDHSARVGRFVYDIMVAVANRPLRLAVLPLEQRDLSARC